MLIGIIGWIVLGAIVGFIVSKIVELNGDDPIIGIGVAAAGGLAGGWLYSLISGAAISKFNIWSLVFAAFGAGVAMLVFHLIRSRSPHAKPTVRRSY